jgi:hypothetical protein
MNRELTLALWTLGRLPSEDLPAIATDWLAEGLDSRSLRELAGVASPVMSDAGPLFERAFCELSIVPPKKETALWFLARHHAQRIVEGVVTPYEGARQIWWEVSNELNAPDQLLLSFVGAASELEDLPERTAQDGHDRKKYARELEEMIFESARELLKKEPNKAPEPTPGAVTPRAT